MNSICVETRVKTEKQVSTEEVNEREASRVWVSALSKNKKGMVTNTMADDIVYSYILALSV